MGLLWVQNVNFDVQKSLTCCVLGWGKGSDVMKLLLCLISKTSNCCPGINDLSKIFVSLAACLNVFLGGAMHRSVSQKVKQIPSWSDLPPHPLGCGWDLFRWWWWGGGSNPPPNRKKLPKKIIFLSKKKLDLGQPLPLVETKSQLFPKHFGVWLLY